MKDTRYPYTYACDLIRITTGHTQEGTKLSRADASKIRELFAKVTGLADEYLAEKLADFYLAYEKQLTDEAMASIKEKGLF